MQTGVTTTQPTSLDHELSPHIAVIGVGGAGCNAVNNMIASGLEGVQFFALNTDSQSLKHALAETRIQLGAHATRGLGAGSKPEIGRASAEESLEEIMAQLQGANMVFITAGMGGGTGTGAAPVIAKACKEADILTVGVVTKPFHFEGTHRMRQADKGIEEMQGYVDTLIVIPNQNLFRIANEKTTFADAFRMADGVLQSGVRGITDLIVRPGLVNRDFADIRTAMIDWMGKAMMGTGEAEGERRAIEASERAINNPLLDDISMKGAKGVIINITGGYDMTLYEVDEACNRIRDEVDGEANIMFGTSFDAALQGKMRVTILATGIEQPNAKRVGGANTQAPAVATAPAQPSYAVPMTQNLVVPQASLAQPRANYDVNAAAQRGARMGTAFIPPRPVEAHDVQVAPNVAAPQPMQYEQPVQMQEPLNLVFPEAAPIAQPEPVQFKPQALKLNPPTPGQHTQSNVAQSKKRSFSLFDKFAGLFQGAGEEETTSQQSSSGRGTASMRSPRLVQAPDMQSTGNQSASFSAPQFDAGDYQAATASLAQPVMQDDPFGMQTPQSSGVYVAPNSVLATKAQEQQQRDQQTDLDIPAFLRRQIS